MGKLKTDGKVQFKATNDRGECAVSAIEPAPRSAVGGP